MHNQNIHIVGICGTFMGGVARLAKNLGYKVSGSDANTYPPMSTQLEALGVDLYEGYSAANISGDVDIVIIGNTIGRGNPELEHVLDNNLRFSSGAQWLGENVLQDRWVLGVAGTHGKTTTSSILTWILEDNGLTPGYLIGGVPENFGESARLGETPFFVIEADEYDTAFSDKRSKFIHYKARTLILNNLEFDHADIFADLKAIQTQFHHLIKTIPSHGQVIHNSLSPAIDEVLSQGCWSEARSFAGNSADWQVIKHIDDASEFSVKHQGKEHSVTWDLIGDHNMFNALAAVAAAYHVGVRVEDATKSLSTFKSVKRRMEKIYDGQPYGYKVRVFDDFAHHPTAIEQTVNGLRNSFPNESIIAILEPRSNTMKQGIHKDLLPTALGQADQALIYASDQVQWDVSQLCNDSTHTFSDVNELLSILIERLASTATDTNVLIMSNGGFEGLYDKLIEKLRFRSS